METVKTVTLKIGGITCASCQNKIEKKLRLTAGVLDAAVSYDRGTAVVTYDTDILSLDDIKIIIQNLGYEVLQDRQPQSDNTRIIGILVIVVALYMLIRQFGLNRLFNAFPLAEAGMGYGMLFVIGLITSVHCIAMCGGINLSQCIPQSAVDGGQKRTAMRPGLLYNLGRVISYTAVGAIVGALGAVISFSGTFKGIIQLLAGVFMVIMGLNMLGVFPWLRRLSPRMPKIFARKIRSEKAESKSPLYVGLLNGLMPCGPLQAMQLYALSTGSPFRGALSMLVFSLGTVPLMFALGALSSILSRKFTRRVMTAGAVLVVVLGLSMFTQGWRLSGFPLPSLLPQPAVPSQTTDTDIKIVDGVQIVNSALSSGRYPAVTVQAGIPVKWTIDAPQGSINGCNNRLFIPEYGIEHTFKPGENIIEFTPLETGKFPYSCWMGMIRGSITVVEAGSDAPNANSPESGGAEEAPAGGDAGSDISAPVAAGVTIPTDTIVLAEIGDDETQKVRVEITDDGISPAIIVMQAGVDTQWVVENNAARPGDDILVVPDYIALVPLTDGDNTLNLTPTKSFEYSTANFDAFGYVKVVDDLANIDLEAIKEEVSSFETLIYPPSYFYKPQNGAAGGGYTGASCH
jgi:sulfite exporter TauE/SafE/copper chaperone CopZ/plastocyanin domain-containing protein